jgi:hypothetical protein
MIQRSQSVYLLLSTVLMSLLIIKPFAQFFLLNNQSVMLYNYAIEKYSGGEGVIVMRTLPLVILALFTMLIGFVTIFLFIRRIYQLRLCLLSLLLMTGLLALMFLYYVIVFENYKIVRHYFKLPAVIPVICIVLNLMAYRAIHRDELLVKSYNRLR